MAIFPVIMVIIAAVSSAVYKHYHSRKLTSRVHCMLVKYHAFATELLQLSVLGTGIIVGWGLFASKTIMLDIYFLSVLDFPVPAWFLATMTVSAYFLAVFVIDLVDNRIQLGCWGHPVQMQTLVLTRALLAPGSVWKLRRGVTRKRGERPPPAGKKKQVTRKKVVDPVATAMPYQRKRTTSEPVTPEMLRRFLREIPLEVSKSGVLIREARACARRSSDATVVVTTPTRAAGKDGLGISLRTPQSMVLDRRYDVQSRVESIERLVGGG